MAGITQTIPNYVFGESNQPEELKIPGFVKEAINIYPDITEGALWYHSDTVKPYWSKQLNRTVTIDNHLFYN